MGLKMDSSPTDVLDARKKSLFRLITAHSSILDAAQGCDLFTKTINHSQHPMFRPLMAWIIISYARPFSQNRPVGPLPAEWARYEDPVLQDIHDRLIAMRHKSIAHCDSGVRLQPPLEQSGLFLGTAPGSQQPLNFSWRTAPGS